jgi:UDP-GlcNAc:undecaprenyl-phosphate GlcNAc-1-phosphate transferase
LVPILLLVLTFFGAIVLTAGLTWIVRDIALKRGWVRGFLSVRHLHSVGLPRLGGVAIASVVSTLSCFALLALFASHKISKTSADQTLLILSVALINFAIGLVDDIFDISAWPKLATEILAGLLLWAGGVRILYFSSLSPLHELGTTVSLALTVLWVVLISNAFNLIDGLDGLAAGSALFSVLTVFIISVAMQNAMQGLLAAILAGAILGFLRYNFNPATIFLGDCGSLFIGTLLAGLTLTGVRQQKSSTLIAVAIPVVACGFPVVETGVSVIRRYLRGQSIFSADREHIHHRLLDRGWSQRQVVVALYGVSAVFGMLSLALLTPGQAPLAIVLFVIGVGVVMGIQKLQYHEFFEVGRMARRALEQKKVIVNNLAVRRGAERLARCHSWAKIIEVLQEIFADNDFDSFVVLLKAKDSEAIAWTHEWQRPVSRLDGELDSSCQWSLALPLRVFEGKWQGVLELSRLDSSALLIDINLLIRELSGELEKACTRAVAVQEATRQEILLYEPFPDQVRGTTERLN